MIYYLSIAYLTLQVSYKITNYSAIINLKTIKVTKIINIIADIVDNWLEVYIKYKVYISDKTILKPLKRSDIHET